MKSSAQDEEEGFRCFLDPGQGHPRRLRRRSLSARPHPRVKADAFHCQELSRRRVAAEEEQACRRDRPYVLDAKATHGWVEIHPAMLIERHPRPLDPYLLEVCDD